MRLAARLLLVGVLTFAGFGGAKAQNLEQFFQDIGRLGQPRRAAIQAEWQAISPGEIACVDNRLRRARRSVNALIDRGIGPSDRRVAGIISDCRTDTAILNGPAAAPGNPAYAVNGMQLGNKVGVGSPDYGDYSCAPSAQYAALTGCQRQTAGRTRRRTVVEADAFLHSADGTAVYINQSLDPVVMDDNDAHDEISRLSDTYGPATLLPMQDTRGVPSGLIASWGAVSLQPLQPERRAALAAGTDDSPGIVIDYLGNPQRSAQLGLPIYQLGGGAGYVWSASWNGRGRGSLRMVAIDASKLPGAVADAKPEPAVAAAVTTAPAVVAAAPEAPKPAEATPQPAATPQAAVVQAAPKPAEPAVAPPQPKATAPAPADVRVVGPPIALRPITVPEPVRSDGGNGLVIFLTALVVVLLGAVGYLWRKTRGIAPAAAAAPSVAAATTPATSAEPVVAAESEKMDLPALVPNESPDSISASKADMDVPKEATITAVNIEGEKRSAT